jgi:hypothetical protein
MNKTIAPEKTSSRREGYAVTLNPLTNTSPESGRYGMDMQQVPVPQRRYAADLCQVRYLHGEIRIMFAQQGFDESDVDSAILIRMNPDATVSFSNSLLDLGLDENTDGMSSSWKCRNEEISNIPSKPVQTVNMVANICSVAIAGQEACMDFYHASAFAVRKAERETELEVEPVVRVDLRTSLFLAFARTIIGFSKKIQEEGESNE